MKLLVIVVGLLCERYLVHVSAYAKFYWFESYREALKSRLPKLPSWLLFLLVILPIILLVWLVLYLFGYLLFGTVGFLLNILIFFYCLGPQNPFYPLKEEEDENIELNQDEFNNSYAGEYFVKVNSQLFTVIFWYVLLGPLAIILYRLIFLSKDDLMFRQQATVLTDIIEWLPARLTSFLYLLVGNFQAAVSDFMRLFFASPDKNSLILKTSGLKSLGASENEEALSRAEVLVEHAVIVLLVLMAFITMAAKL